MYGQLAASKVTLSWRSSLRLSSSSDVNDIVYRSTAQRIITPTASTTPTASPLWTLQHNSSICQLYKLMNRPAYFTNPKHTSPKIKLIFPAKSLLIPQISQQFTHKFWCNFTATKGQKIDWQIHINKWIVSIHKGAQARMHSSMHARTNGHTKTQLGNNGLRWVVNFKSNIILCRWTKKGYADGAGNTVEENSSVFSLILMRKLPSVLWHCWLSGRKGIWPVKNMGGMVVGTG